MQRTTFKVGDLVRLKSGGPPMTIDLIHDDREGANCVWFEGRDKKLEYFTLATLEPFDPHHDRPVLFRS